MRNQAFYWLIQIVGKVVEFAALYAWQIQGIHSAWNVLRFWIWLHAVIGILVLFAPPNSKRPSIPKAIRVFGVAAGLLFIGCLVWFGHFLLGSLYLVGLVFTYAHYDASMSAAEKKSGDTT